MAKTATARANPKNVISMGKARGDALAEMYLKTVGEQAKSLGRILADVVRADRPAQTAFRLSLKTSLDAAREMVKKAEALVTAAIEAGKSDEEVMKLRDEHYRLDRTFSSQKTRVSEARQFVVALEATYNPDPKDVEADYHAAIGNARLFLRKKGQASARGRKATPADIKFVNAAKRFVDNGDLTIAGLREAIKKVQAAMKGWKEPEAKPAQNSGAQVEAPVDNPRKVGPTQRKERKARNQGDGFVPVKQPSHQAPAATH